MKKIFGTIIIIFLFVSCIKEEIIHEDEVVVVIDDFEENTKNDMSSDGFVPLTQEQKIEDFNYMFEVLKNNYPYFEINSRLYDTDWVENEADYRNMIMETTSDLQFQIKIKSILKELNNSHTSLYSAEGVKGYYNLYLSNNIHEEWREILEREEVIQRYFGDIDLDEIVEESEEYFYVEGNIATDILIEEELAYIEIKSFEPHNYDKDKILISEFIEEVESYDNLIIDLRNNGGGSSRYWTDLIIPMIINQNTSVTSFSFVKGDYAIPFFEDVYNGNINKLLMPVSEWKETISLDSNFNMEDFKYFFANEQVIEPSTSTNFTGEVYILVGPKVYSASENMTIFAKESGIASIVGSKTGGGGLGVITPVICSLPNSGLVFRFPSVLGMSESGVINEEYHTEPDIYIENLDELVKMIQELE